MKYRRFEDTIIVRIDRGEEILEKMKEVALKENVRLASVEALGAVDDFTVGVYNVDEKKFYPNTREGKGEGHTIEVCWAGHDDFITVPDPKVQLAVGTLQAFIDEYLKKFGGEVDYIHGDEVTRELGSKEGNMGFLLPAMGKEQLFKTVMADGVLPRKTFSMGHAQDKRYYVEARKIR